MITKGYEIYKRSACILLLIFVSLCINEMNNVVASDLSISLNGIELQGIPGASDDYIIHSVHASENCCNTNFYDMV